MQRGLSVSSRPRALAYSISVCRAASQRSALVNFCVDITAPLTAPSQLMTIRTWVVTSSSPSRLALRASAAANNLLLRLGVPRCAQAGRIARTIQISKTAPIQRHLPRDNQGNREGRRLIDAPRQSKPCQDIGQRQLSFRSPPRLTQIDAPFSSRLSRDSLYQREALNSRVCGSVSPCNAEDARWGGPTMAAIKPAFPGHPILPTAQSRSVLRSLLSVIAWGLKRRV